MATEENGWSMGSQELPLQKAIDISIQMKICCWQQIINMRKITSFSTKQIQKITIILDRAYADSGKMRPVKVNPFRELGC
jgi:hypothetical protein